MRRKAFVCALVSALLVLCAATAVWALENDYNGGFCLSPGLFGNFSNQKCLLQANPAIVLHKIS